jgi:hypothetical protein
MFRLCSFSHVREGLLKRSFDDSMERADPHAYARYRTTGRTSLNSLDDSITHTKFMHHSSVRQRQRARTLTSG